MMRIKSLDPEFVRHIPVELEPGKLYVSMEYATAAHSCCCGCGEEVVTPFTPTDWSMTFDGESVSLSPSVGNWYLPCKSHYVLRRGRVVEAGPWSEEQIEAEWGRDREAKAKYYEGPPAPRTVAELKEAAIPEKATAPAPTSNREQRGFFGWLGGLWRKR